MPGKFTSLAHHHNELRQELMGQSFSQEERAAILSAETANWYIDVKVMPEVERLLTRAGLLHH